MSDELNVCGMCCPMPLINIRKAVEGLQPGDTIHITGDDPVFQESVEDFCEENNHQIIEVTKEGRTVHLVVKVGE